MKERKQNEEENNADDESMEAPMKIYKQPSVDKQKMLSLLYKMLNKLKQQKRLPTVGRSITF